MFYIKTVQNTETLESNKLDTSEQAGWLLSDSDELLRRVSL